MDQAKGLCFEEENDDQQKKSSKFDLERDYSFHTINKDHNPTLEDEENSVMKERNPSQIEASVSSMTNGASKTPEDSITKLNSSESVLEENNSKTKENVGEKDNDISNENEGEEEGTYEELICLVRQFYVEKPINPAALAHQNIETC